MALPKEWAVPANLIIIAKSNTPYAIGELSNNFMAPLNASWLSHLAAMRMPVQVLKFL
jgi:hypothetical protein